MFKHLFLQNRWANQSQISYGAYVGRGNESLFGGVWVTWPKWPPRPYMVETLKKTSSPEPKGQWHRGFVYSIGDLGPTKFVHMMTLGWPWPFYGKVKCFLIWENVHSFRKNIRKSFNGSNNKWPEWRKLYVCIKMLTPRGCLPLPRDYKHA